MFPFPFQNMSAYMKLFSFELWVNALTQNSIYYPYAEPTQSHIPLRSVKAKRLGKFLASLCWFGWCKKKHEHKYIMLVLLIRIYRLNEISKTCSAFGIALCCVRPSLLHGKLTYLFLFMYSCCSLLAAIHADQWWELSNVLYKPIHAQSCNRPTIYAL
jgi:hypothetical protein